MAQLFYCVGNSDVTTEKGNFRENTKSLLEKINQTEDIFKKADFPIAKSLVEYVEKNAVQFSKVLLIATDQDPPHHQDTIFAAELLKKYLSLKMRLEKNSGTVEIYSIKEDPSNYDIMLNKFRNFVAQKVAGDEEYMLFITTGTPAMTTALLLNFAPYVGNSTVLYLPRGKQEPIKVELLKEIAQRKWKDALIQAVENYHYSEAINILRISNIRDRSSVELLTALDHLCNFRRREAVDCFTRYRSFPGIDMPSSISRYFNKLPEATHHNLLELLLSNIHMRYNQGDMVSVVAYTFRFLEAILQEQVKKALYINDVKKEFERAINGQDALSRYFCSKSVSAKPTRLAFKLVLKHFNREGKGEYEPILQLYEKLGADASDDSENLNSLADLRNQGPCAHGFLGVGEDDIKRLYKGDLIEDLINHFERYIGRSFFNIYQQANKILVKEYEKIS